LIFNYGIFSVITPYILLTSFLLAFHSWLYLRKTRNLYFVDLEEQEFQKQKRIEKRKENEEHKTYKWDKNDDDDEY